jgi:hypothetical protein
MTETERLMVKARTALLLSQPFFGTLALRLKNNRRRSDRNGQR